ncbi:effector binding domain-containing protein [Pseudobacteriovorax antillogorgiicola]|nr:effector binding domain-containing protein [Pseudobacteriovorax antillogorgiicola]
MQHYIPAVRKALAYIENQLAHPISLEAVAETAGYSLYHFQRLFAALVGEPLADYIRKRRLTEAANKLMRTKISILNIALEAQFESQQSFHRAFKRFFNQAPGAFRRKPQPFFQGRPPVSQEMLKNLAGDFCALHDEVLQEEAWYVGMGRALGADHVQEAGRLWHDFMSRQHEINGRCSDQTYGVCMNKDADIPSRYGSYLTYLACCRVERVPDEVPPGMIRRLIPGARYARFRHDGPLDAFASTLDFIWGKFLPESDYDRLDGPDMEIYDADFDPIGETVRIDVLIPVAIGEAAQN